jgi:hypothetical protein
MTLCAYKDRGECLYITLCCALGKKSYTVIQSEICSSPLRVDGEDQFPSFGDLFKNRVYDAVEARKSQKALEEHQNRRLEEERHRKEERCRK